MSNIGQNISATIEGGKLTLVIDCNKSIGPSSTGKLMGIASTGGFIMLENGVKLNLYAGRKA